MTKIAINRKGKTHSLRYLCLKSDISKGTARDFSISNDKGLRRDVAVFNIDGNFYAISNICAHKGASLSKGILQKNIVACHWHGWKYDVRSGKSPHKRGDNVDSFKVKVVGNRLYIDPAPVNLGTRQYKPHEAYANLQESVRNSLAHKYKDSSVSLDSRIRVLGISTTN
jgi:nitrite reductase/ring-hydroxylating ferredoxin subunit